MSADLCAPVAAGVDFDDYDSADDSYGDAYDNEPITANDEFDAVETADIEDELDIAEPVAASGAEYDVVSVLSGLQNAIENLAVAHKGTRADENATKMRSVDVVMRLEGSLKDLASGDVSSTMELPATFRGFDPVDAKAGSKRTKSHKPGVIRIKELSNDMKVAIILGISEKLVQSGVTPTVMSQQGVKGAYIVLPNKKVSFSENEMPILWKPNDDNMTNDFIRDFPEFHNSTDTKYTKISDSADPKQVRMHFKNPVLAMMNSLREQSGIGKLTSNLADNAGEILVDKEEAGKAQLALNEVIKKEVNVINLYKALSIKVERAFASVDEKLNKDAQYADSAWLDSAEIVANTARVDSESSIKKAQEVKRSLYMVLNVEFLDL